MEALIFYCGKVIICSGVMFLYYQLSLKDKTFHHYNRFYLLSAMLISILLPLIKVENFTIEVNSDVYLLINKIQNLNSNKNIDHDYLYIRIIFSALGLVSLCFLGKLIYGIVKIIQFKNKFQKESFEGVNFYQTNLSEAPFSYFKNLFWKNTIVINSDIGRQILKHEMVHIEQKHSYDKIFIEIVTSVFWFNPFFYLIKKEIGLIHEYLADNKAVKQSDTKAFAQMLLASHFSGTMLPATSPFLSSNLKKRLKMLQKPKTKFGYARRIFALPMIFTLAFAYMVNAKNKEIEKVNNDIQKMVKSLNTSPENEEKSRRNSNGIVNDTIRPQISENKETTVISDVNDGENNTHPFDKVIHEADKNDVFLVNGKRVGQSDFLNFFENNRNTPDYIFSQSKRKNNDGKIVVYSAAHRNDKGSNAIRNKIEKDNDVGEERVLYMNKFNVSDEERENLRKSVLETHKAKKSAESAKNDANEYSEFYIKATKANQEAMKNAAKQKQEMKHTIIAMRKGKFKFEKGRNYEQNPLTKAELQELKLDAEQIKILNEKRTKSNFGIFKITNTTTQLFDKNGNEIIIDNDKLPVVKSNTMMIDVNGSELYVNGKKVSKDEFLKYQSDFKDVKSEPKIKVFKIERVGDANRSYAKKMEIITDNNFEVTDDTVFYLNGKLAKKEDINRIDSKNIERMDVSKKNDKGKQEIRIETKN